MKTYYEVRHCGRVKRFDDVQSATKHASALIALGYSVKVFMITQSLYSTVSVSFPMNTNESSDEKFRRLLSAIKH